MVLYTIHLLFVCYTFLIFARIVGSWFPAMAASGWMRLIGQCTDPYLNCFRRFIPPIGGVLDLSPLLAFFILQLSEQLLMTILR